MLRKENIVIPILDVTVIAQSIVGLRNNIKNALKWPMFNQGFAIIFIFIGFSTFLEILLLIVH